MKNSLFITLFLVLSSYLVTVAQTATKQPKINAIITASGNYQQMIITAVPQEKDTDTGKTYTDSKGEVYTVYKTSKEKLYIVKVSKKTNKSYRKYLTV